MEKLKNDLKNLLAAFSGDARKIDETADRLIAKYSEPHRAYHNLSHVAALLSNAEPFKNIFADDMSVRLAIWFHDVIYDPQRLQNETESAALAVKKLSELKFPKENIAKVEKMILATQKHDAIGLDHDGEIFLDLDLGILGASADVYKKYAAAIREEYSFVPEKTYREKRAEVLRNFLRREFIYYSKELRASHEEQARANIANEIKELSLNEV